SLYHTITSRLFDCDARMVSAAAHSANIKKISLVELLAQSTNQEILDAIEKLKNWHSRTKSTDIRTLSYEILTESGLKDNLYEEAKNDIKTAGEVQTLSQWFKSLKEFEKITLTPSVVSYLENFPVLRTEGEKLHDDTLDIVSDKPVVMTMHKAKGLEWQTVYVIGCASGSFPYLSGGSGLQIPEELSENSAADMRLSEERRLMYVAVTRARDDLILTYATK